MSGESKDYAIFRKNIWKLGDRIDRIENIMVIGMPDINCCIDSCEFWIELKSPIEPKRGRTRLLAGNNNHPLSQEQKNWFKRQTDAKGDSYLLIATDKRWMLIGGNLIEWYGDINEKTVSELLTMSSWSCDKPIRRESWDQLRTWLKRKLL